MFIDVFAPAGARTLSINGVAFDDSIAGALTVEAVTPAALTSGVLATGDFAAPFESDLFTVPAALIGDVHDFEVSRSASSDLSQPVGVFYTDDSGLDPIGFAYNIGGFFGFDLVPFQERYFAPGKDLILVMTDFGLGGGADDYGYKIDFAKTAAVALTAATPDTGNTIAASGDTNWYFTTAANKWNVVTFTATPTGAAQLDGMVFGFRKGAVQDNELPFVDATGTGAPESLKFLAGSSLRAFVGVADFFDAFGADTQHDAGFTEAAIPGVLVESQTTNVPLVDALNAELGITEATMNVASVTPIVAGTLYLAVDLDHTWISDLSIQLESPLGTVVTVSNGFGGSDDGIIDVFGASGQPGTTRNASALSAFNGEVPTGLWTVRFIDDTEADTGLLRGVAIAIP